MASEKFEDAELNKKHNKAILKDCMVRDNSHKKRKRRNHSQQVVQEDQREKLKAIAEYHNTLSWRDKQLLAWGMERIGLVSCTILFLLWIIKTIKHSCFSEAKHIGRRATQPLNRWSRILMYQSYLDSSMHWEAPARRKRPKNAELRCWAISIICM